MESNQQIALGATLISIVSACVSIFFAWKTSKRADEALKLQLNTAKRTDKNLELQYISKIQDWAKEVIVAMSDAILLGEYDPAADKSFFDKRIQSLSKLSALLDQGRMFFPNYATPRGQEKPIAYQGTRQKILDRIMEVFDLVKGMNYEEKGNNKGISRAIVEGKRHFVSEVQKIISPRENQAFFTELRGKFIENK